MAAGEINGATCILGVIADPVAQARSPGMANARLAQRSALGRFVLVPMHVGADGLGDVLAGMRRVRNFAGAIVSMPHKSAALPLLDEATEEARLVGAVNVVRRDADGRLSGTILDGEGFVAGLRGAGHDIAGASCLLAGAGGAAAAIAFALARHGCASLTIANRTRERAEALATRVRSAFPGVQIRSGDAAASGYDLAINATSLGMREGDALPFPREVAAASHLVAECVIAPEITRLLEIATRAGRAIHTGVPMLAAQMELMLDFMTEGGSGTNREP